MGMQKLLRAVWELLNAVNAATDTATRDAAKPQRPVRVIAAAAACRQLNSSPNFTVDKKGAWIINHVSFFIQLRAPIRNGAGRVGRS